MIYTDANTPFQNIATLVTIESQGVAARPAATGTPKTTPPGTTKLATPSTLIAKAPAPTGKTPVPTLKADPSAPRLKITLALPKHANVQLLAPDNTLVAQAIADGTELFLLQPAARNNTAAATTATTPANNLAQRATFTRAPLHRGRAAFAPSLSNHPLAPALALGGLLPDHVVKKLLGEDPLPGWKAEKRLVHAKALPDALLAQEPCRVLTFLVRDDPPPQSSEGLLSAEPPAKRITYWIAKRDGALRQVEQVPVGLGARPTRLLLRFSQVSTSPRFSPGAFAFVPPPGAIGTGAPTATLAQGLPIATAIPAPAGALALPRIPPRRTPPPSPPPAPLPKAAPPSPGAPSLAPAVERHDFGAVDALEKPRLLHRFTYRNATDKPLELAAPRASCYCISGTFAGKKEGEGARLEPGQSIDVEAALDFTGVRSGPLSKSLVLSVPGQGAPLAAYTLQANVAAPLTLIPDVLAFGAIKEGEEKKLVLSAYLDPRLLDKLPGKGKDLRLAALEGASPLKFQLLDESIDPASKKVLRRYQVSLEKDAPLGPVLTRLALVPPPGSPTAWDGLWQVSAVVATGQVSGDVSAFPQILALGAVGAGQGASAQLVLVAPRTSALEGVRVKSEHPGLTARLGVGTPLRDGAGNAVPQQVILVELSKDAPAGNLNTRLVVTLASGRQLLIPVNGFIPPSLPGPPR